MRGVVAVAVAVKKPSFESPTLSLVRNDWCDTLLGDEWLCAEKLVQFYDIPNRRGTRIRLIARKRPDPGFTHELEVSERYPYLFEPVICNLWRPFWVWLRAQIQEGRTHIGVMVTPEEGPR